MVRASVRQREEEDLQGSGPDHLGPKTQNVQLSGVERPQDRLQEICQFVFCCAVEDQDNELITLEIIHRYVELLDKYFGSVCELDIIFNFEKAYFILDEFLLGGEAQETSKKNVLKAIEQADLLQEEAEAPRSVLEEIGLT
ncbi:hypothetical protein WMY93_012979 [Mugilogobius chulae]|uniref:AP complex mu/sigma subunit domain-containing protein n=1 Tax=Mugilogobius chulae TaxID=88201 RepID=A0AAW0NZ06_9GOBI